MIPFVNFLGANSQKPNYNFVLWFSSTAVVPSFDEKTMTDAKLSEAGTVAVDLGSGLIVYYNGGCAFKLEEGAVSSIFVIESSPNNFCHRQCNEHHHYPFNV